MIQTVRDFINYWYFRYLLVTELYMVEKWERTMFHVVLFFILAILYIFNSVFTLGLVRWISNSYIHGDTSKDIGIQPDHVGQEL